jgi:hypothetical protein
MTSAPPYPFPGGIQGDEPPDPVAGQPGHFAWSRWIKEFVKRLDNTDMVLDAKVESKLDAAGGSVTGDLSVGGDLSLAGALEVPAPTAGAQAANKAYVDRHGAGAVAAGDNSVRVAWGSNGATTAYVIPLTKLTLYGDDITLNVNEQSITVNSADTYLFNYTVFSESTLASVQRHVWLEFKQTGWGWRPVEASRTSGWGSSGYPGSGHFYLNGGFISRPFAGNAYRLMGSMTASAASPVISSTSNGGGSFKALSLQVVRIGAQTT